MGLEKTLKSVKKDSEVVHILLEKCIQYSIKYAQAYKDIGANGYSWLNLALGSCPPIGVMNFPRNMLKDL